METIEYNGQRVYTQANITVQDRNLMDAKVGTGVVLDAYFFEITGDRLVEKIGFDRQKVKDENSGLMIDVKSQFGGQASVSIAGLERVTSFLYDTGSLGDLSVLKGKKFTEYARGLCLLGIGVDITA